MLVDRIENLKLYIPYDEKLATVCEFLDKTDVLSLEVGKFEIDNGIRVIVNAFTAKERDVAKWETHNKYIDLQYLIEGNEIMGWLPIDQMEDAEYNSEKDISYPVPKKDAVPSDVILETGSFAYLEPRDAHRPCVKLTADNAKKLIFKIPVKE